MSDDRSETALAADKMQERIVYSGRVWQFWGLAAILAVGVGIAVWQDIAMIYIIASIAAWVVFSLHLSFTALPAAVPRSWPTRGELPRRSGRGRRAARVRLQDRQAGCRPRACARGVRTLTSPTNCRQISPRHIKSGFPSGHSMGVTDHVDFGTRRLAGRGCVAAGVPGAVRGHCRGQGQAPGRCQRRRPGLRSRAPPTAPAAQAWNVRTALSPKGGSQLATDRDSDASGWCRSYSSHC